ncbi:hypothetical protein A3770_15p76000 [Chloropicon primus]|uniref:Uncharacterized protein n=1 Tax=Chloropicon primus TaxID=1764295 RepID=A0A5B8MZK6_9CHLO|nr:hypothetical protein A3770_15p76000 [Chloropicon primus]|eukprot:QDZ25082.1 hypothetical protein A3770_15p76000 [Chloropicon primus]
MGGDDGFGTETPSSTTSRVSNKVAAFLSWVLQRVVFFLETVIEWLSSSAKAGQYDTPGAQERKKRKETERVLAKARKLADYGDSEKALKLLIGLLESQPECTGALDLAAEVLLETGDYLGAKELVLRSIQINPKENEVKYVLLGQLEHGREAIDAFKKGYDVLVSQYQSLKVGSTEAGKLAKEAASRREALQLKMSSVLTSIAKVYLVDCFHEEKAELLCEETIDQALLYDPNNPEAVQALADLRLSQHRKGEALSLVQRTLDLCAKVGTASYDFRAVTARLLVELSKYDVAINILKDLVSEDEEDTEVWYLLGLCYALTGDGTRSKAALTKAKSIIETVSGADASLIERIDKLNEHRVISEVDKDKYWNPRWWASKEEDKDAGKANLENGDEALTLIPLSEKDPSLAKAVSNRLEV